MNTVHSSVFPFIFDFYDVLHLRQGKLGRRPAEHRKTGPESH